MPSNIIIWGDSHAEGGAAAMGARDMGIAGKQLRDLRSSFPPSSIPRGSRVAIQIGTNDLTINSRWSDRQIRDHAGSVINTALEMRAGGSTPVIYAIPIPQRPYSGGNWTEQTLREFQENARIYNQELERRATAAGIRFINFQPSPNDFSRDNLHLTQAGYRRMYQMMNNVSSDSAASAETSGRITRSPQRQEVQAPPSPPQRRAAESPAELPRLTESQLGDFLKQPLTSERVRELQRFLNIDVDGKFGPQTMAALLPHLQSADMADHLSNISQSNWAMFGRASRTTESITYIRQMSQSHTYVENALKLNVTNLADASPNTLQARQLQASLSGLRLFDGDITGAMDSRVNESLAQFRVRYPDARLPENIGVVTSENSIESPAGPSAATPLAPSNITISPEADVRSAFPVASAVLLQTERPLAATDENGLNATRNIGSPALPALALTQS